MWITIVCLVDRKITFVPEFLSNIFFYTSATLARATRVDIHSIQVLGLRPSVREKLPLRMEI